VAAIDAVWHRQIAVVADLGLARGTLPWHEERILGGNEISGQGRSMVRFHRCRSGSRESVRLEERGLVQESVNLNDRSCEAVYGPA
jgi:hypothetical protein